MCAAYLLETFEKPCTTFELQSALSYLLAKLASEYICQHTRVALYNA